MNKNSFSFYKRDETMQSDLERLRRVKDEYYEAKNLKALTTINADGEIISEKN